MALDGGMIESMRGIAADQKELAMINAELGLDIAQSQALQGLAKKLQG